MFWSIGDATRRHDFLIHNVRRVKKKRATTENSRRANSLFYFLPLGDSDTSVCKTLFMNTLDVSSMAIGYALDHGEHGLKSPNAPKVAQNKTSDERMEGIRVHINSFPVTDSHYCRKDTKRQYPEEGLSVNAMYRLYCEWCRAENLNPASACVYRKAFNTEFNMGFWIPGKDQCDTCTLYNAKVKTKTNKAEDDEEYEQHQKRKTQAREAKQVVKQPREKMIAMTFDLEHVLNLPKLNVGSAYYSRKLNFYNLTIFQLQDKSGYCYMWPESEAGRGAKDISSAVWFWLNQKDREGMEHAILYSDTCGGQNHNRIFSTTLITMLSRSVSLKRIDHQFFESGHSFMECDTMIRDRKNGKKQRKSHSE